MSNVEQMEKIETTIETTEEKKQFVTFSIGNEKFGIDVSRAQEVLNLIEITRVPNTMPFMKGVINLRDKIVPLIDMRIKFNLEEKEYDQSTVIIIVEANSLLVGMIVDSVSDVTSMSIGDIHDTAHFALEIDKDAVLGFGKVNNQLIVVLDVDRILTKEEIENITQK